jgi:hypothetical protein
MAESELRKKQKISGRGAKPGTLAEQASPFQKLNPERRSSQFPSDLGLAHSGNSFAGR